MSSSFIPFVNLKPIRKEVEEAIQHVLQKGVFMNGMALENFTTHFSAFMGIKYVVPTANCTDALEILLRTQNLTQDDEVLTSAFTWFSDASVIHLVGAKTVFCDISLTHFGIDFTDFKNRVTTNTKVLILPHLFGLTHPDIEAIAAFCMANSIFLIEDCAQAHGSRINDKLAGTFGDATAFSFYPTKNLGALGDAGCIVTDKESLAHQCKLWGNHGQSSRNDHKLLGRNSRMDELQAAILVAKLPFLETDNQKRRILAKMYFEELKGLDIALPLEISGHVYHQFVIRTDRRDELLQFLIEQGVETDIHYPTALSNMPVFQSEYNYQNASLAADTVLSLPIHPQHTEEEIEFVAKCIRSFFTKKP